MMADSLGLAGAAALPGRQAGCNLSRGYVAALVPAHLPASGNSPGRLSPSPRMGLRPMTLRQWHGRCVL